MKLLPIRKKLDIKSEYIITKLENNNNQSYNSDKKENEDEDPSVQCTHQ